MPKRYAAGRARALGLATRGTTAPNRLRRVDRWLTGGRSPVGMHRAVKNIGGVCGAILVALIVFGGGSGDGGGTGDGATATASTGAGDTRTTAPTDARPELPPPPENPAVEETVRVTVLSGADVKELRFYLIEGDRTPKDLAELRVAIAARKAKAAKKLAVEVRLAPRTDQQNSGVLDLVNYARDDGMRVILPQKE